jgi:mono/diheme cytochrome c family protein
MVKYSILSLGICLLWLACSPAGGNKPGHEFMPDMVHTTGYEANYYDYYYYNRWGSEAEYKKFASPRLPVKGTIARGYAGSATASDAGVSHANGSVPYYYADTEDDRQKAAREIILNPYPITANGLTQGKKLYEINCAICHGAKGDGAGYLVRDDGGKYPVAPANFLQDTFYKSSNGRYYHAILYGKNAMGSYADKLSYEERWQVIHYIRSLQAKELKKVYDADQNTLTQVDIPQAKWLSQLPADLNAKNNESALPPGGDHHAPKTDSPKH